MKFRLPFLNLIGSSEPPAHRDLRFYFLTPILVDSAIARVVRTGFSSLAVIR